MTRKYSEGEVRKALGAMELDYGEPIVFKPTDLPGPGQKKPCDFMVWWPDVVPDFELTKPQVTGAAWIEVKESPNIDAFPLSEIAPTQVAGMRQAVAAELPYFLVVYWPKRKGRRDLASRPWTITPATEVLARLSVRDTRMRYDQFPINCATGQLGSHLRLMLLGELDR